jgi:hypothetical protein
MARLHDPGPAGQGTDPSALSDPLEPRTRSTTLRLTQEEAHAVRIAIRKVAAARGGYVALAVRIGIPTPRSTTPCAPVAVPPPGSRFVSPPSPGCPSRCSSVARLLSLPPSSGWQHEDPSARTAPPAGARADNRSRGSRRLRLGAAPRRCEPPGWH